MGDVVEFGRKTGETTETTEAHLAGTFVCGACTHEWVGVAPVGQTHVDCPKCGRLWGTAKNAVVPEVSWRCNCGERLFWLTPTGALCRSCGVYSNDWAR